MEGEPIDFDRGNVNTGTTVQIFNYLDNSWKAATVQEIDLAEREILVTYDDDTQEWVGVDGRKICFPPAIVPKPDSAVSHREDNYFKAKKHANESKSNSLKEKNRTAIVRTNQLKKSRSHATMKSVKHVSGEKKTVSKSSASSGFLRLKFKPINKSSKLNVKSTEPSRKRKKEKQFVQDATVDSSEIGDATVEANLEGKVAKGEQLHMNESKRESCKLRIRIDKNEARVITSKDGWLSDKVETSSFGITNEKKIKTLLPKRSATEAPDKVPSPGMVSQADSSNFAVSSALGAPNCSTAIPTLNFSPTSSRYICPKQDCKKQFRNENLLMMHIKHYHREYRNLLRSMPNVADLAYARTVGEHIESPQANFLEKIAKLEENKLNKVDEDNEETKLHGTSLDEKMSCTVDKLSKMEEKALQTSNLEGTAEVNKLTMKTSSKRSLLSKRQSSSELSPKLPVLMAQLQGPPLVPSSISFEADAIGVELSVSQKKLSSVSSPQCSEQSDSFVDSDERPESHRRSPSKKRRLSQLDSTDVINCSCGYGLEDGLMIQCDLCQCWQHGSCVGFENESDVPSNYTCETCQFPKRCHSSRRYSYVQNWLKEGIVPKFHFGYRDEELQKKREKYLKQIHSFLCELSELRNAVRCLQLKIQILRQTPDHPKLYLWAKSWDDEPPTKDKVKEENETTPGVGPVPEDAINMVDCRKHLSDHVTKEIEKVDNVLQDIEEKVQKLEEPECNEGGGRKGGGGRRGGEEEEEEEEEDDWNRDMEKYIRIVKQTLLMMLRDLSSLQKFKYCCE